MQRRAAAGLAALVLIAALGPWARAQQVPAAAPVASAAAAQPASAPASAAASALARPKASAVRTQGKPAAEPRAETKPTWAELTPSQQDILAPLGGTWSTLSEGHKRKWLALSQGYPKMPADEQAKLRSRMTEWAALTPQQRVQARLNFAETKKLPGTDKKAAWEAYQALPPEEKRRLAASASVNKPPPIAAAVRPVPPQKLASTPKAAASAPRIAVVPASGARPAASH